VALRGTGSNTRIVAWLLSRQPPPGLLENVRARLAARLPQAPVDMPAVTIARAHSDAVAAVPTRAIDASSVAAAREGMTADEESLRGAAMTGAEITASPATRAVPAAAAPNAPLDAGSLLGLVLRARWHRFVAWLLRRAPSGS
jgi:hypothetical protein